mgnify:CR=1 FL=1
MEENSTGLEILQNASGGLADILKRHSAKKTGAPMLTKCPSHLREFATTLHFFSPRAYRYVRTYLGECLPHVRTVRKWNKELNKAPDDQDENIEIKISTERRSPPCDLVIDDNLGVGAMERPNQQKETILTESQNDILLTNSQKGIEFINRVEETETCNE